MDDVNVTETTLQEALAGIEKLSGCGMCQLHEAREAQKNEVIVEYANRIVEIRIKSEAEEERLGEMIVDRHRTISRLYMGLIAALFIGYMAGKVL